MIPKDLILETPMVSLRPLAEADKTALFNLAQDEGMWNYFSLNLQSQAGFNQWMADALREKEAGTRRPFVIIVKATGELAGSMSIGNISMHDLRMEIGWSWLGAAFRSKGINRQAKYALLEYGFEKLNMERVEFKTDVLNARARKGLENIGGRQEGILRSHMTMWNNRRRDSVYYSILKNEWQELKKTIFKDIAGL